MEGLAVNEAFWRGRSTLVTGAAGLLGPWLTRRLVERGADVVCLVRDRVPQSELWRSGLVDRVKLVYGDVRDQPALERILGEYEVDTVCHLAAQAIVGIANRNPVSTFESNIAGTWRLLEACRRSPLVRQIVVASSDKAYGDHGNESYAESTPLQGRHPYDVSKSCADLLAQTYAHTWGTPVVITRCGNFYGGGDLNWNRLVPGTIRSVLRNTRPVIRSDGNYVRDYFFIEDGAFAYMVLAEKLSEDRTLIGRAFNFSNEQPKTVLALVQEILQAMDSNLEPEVRNEVTNEIPSQRLNATRARIELGWSPQFTLLEGLHRTIQWYREFFK
jgi:CDP-glucose 4,6-dehydratase